MTPEEVLAWLAMPDGRLVGFGSTGDTLISPVWGSRGTVPGLLEDRIVNRTLLHAATAGALESKGTNGRQGCETAFDYLEINLPSAGSFSGGSGMT